MICRPVSTVLIFLLPLHLHAQITIVKEAEHQNPALYVQSFSGSEEIEAVLRSTLSRCGWFRMMNAQTPEGYVLKGQYAPGSGGVLDLQVSREGQTAAAIRQPVGDNPPRLAVYAAVDALIEKLFDTPGPCLSRLAFVLEDKGKKEIVTANFDGSDMQRLTHNRSISTEPAWGRDGRNLVYTLYRNNQTVVVQMDSVQNRQRRIAAFPGLNAGAALSPDNQFAALCLSLDKQVDLYIMRISDGKLRRLTRDRSVESSPTWSPDGRRLCYVSDRSGGRPQLFLIPVAGGRPERLFADYDEAVSPDWSPVSNKIAFATRNGRQYVVAVVDMAKEAREKQVVTTQGGDFEAPSWGGDGRHLVCTQETGGGRRVVMVDTWLQVIRPVTEPGRLSLPSWGAR